MPTTPPLDNKQEPIEYTTDQVGPDLDEKALFGFKSRFYTDEIKENLSELTRFPVSLIHSLLKSA